MTIRVHGATGGDRLGYFQGDNAILTFMFVGAANFGIEETGVVTTAADLLVLHHDSGLEYTGASLTFTELPAASRTVNGVQYDTEAAWTAAFNRQQNLRRLIESIQQRSVIIASRAATGTVGDNADDIIGIDLASSKVTTTAVDNDPVALGSFLIERAQVWDEYFPNTYGQLAAKADQTHVGKIFSDLITQMVTDGVFVNDTGLVSTVGTAGTGQFQIAADHIGADVVFQMPLVI